MKRACSLRQRLNARRNYSINLSLNGNARARASMAFTGAGESACGVLQVP